MYEPHVTIMWVLQALFEHMVRPVSSLIQQFQSAIQRVVRLTYECWTNMSHMLFIDSTFHKINVLYIVGDILCSNGHSPADDQYLGPDDIGTDSNQFYSWQFRSYGTSIQTCVWAICNIPGLGTPTPVHGREVPRWWPPFWGFSIRLNPFLITQHNPIDPLFLQKSRFVSITFSFRDTRT